MFVTFERSFWAEATGFPSIVALTICSSRLCVIPFFTLPELHDGCVVEGVSLICMFVSCRIARNKLIAGAFGAEAAFANMTTWFLAAHEVAPAARMPKVSRPPLLAATHWWNLPTTCRGLS